MTFYTPVKIQKNSNLNKDDLKEIFQFFKATIKAMVDTIKAMVATIKSDMEVRHLLICCIKVWVIN